MSTLTVKEQIEKFKSAWRALENDLIGGKNLSQRISELNAHLNDIRSVDEQLRNLFIENVCKKLSNALLRIYDVSIGLARQLNSFLQNFTILCLENLQSDQEYILDFLFKVFSLDQDFYRHYKASPDEITYVLANNKISSMQIDDNQKDDGSNSEKTKTPSTEGETQSKEGQENVVNGISTSEHDENKENQNQNLQQQQTQTHAQQQQEVEPTNGTEFYRSNLRVLKDPVLKAVMDRIRNKNPAVLSRPLTYLIHVAWAFREIMSTVDSHKLVITLWEEYSKHMLSLSHEQLKNDSRKSLNECLNFNWRNMLSSLFPTEEANERIERFSLQMSVKFFQSPFMEKRITGITDFREMIQFLSNPNRLYWLRMNSDDQTQTIQLFWMTPEWFANWLKDFNIIGILFGDAAHTELVRRAELFPKFLAEFDKLDKKDIDLIWNCAQGKHESLTRCIFENVIPVMTQTMKPEDVDYLWNKIVHIPISEYTLQTLTLIFQFSKPAIERNATESNSQRKWYGLDTFWQLIQDEANAPIELSHCAVLWFADMLNWDPCLAMRNFYMEKCIENLSQHRSIPRTLMVLTNIIKSFDRSHYDRNYDPNNSMAYVIEWLVKDHRLLDFLLEDLQFYHSRALEASKKMQISQLNVDQSILYGKQTHSHNIESRTALLDQLITNTQLHRPHLDVLWNCLVHDPVSFSDRNLAFIWLENLRGLPASSRIITDEDTEYLLTQRFVKLNYSELTQAAVSFFEYFFRWVNWRHNHFEHSTSIEPPGFRVLTFDLIAISEVWKIALEARDDVVAKKAIYLLNNLYKNFAPELRGEQADAFEKYISTSMQFLQQAVSKTSSNPRKMSIPNLAVPVTKTPSINSNSNNNITELQLFYSPDELTVFRCLLLIRTFLEEFELKLSVDIPRHGFPSSAAKPFSVKINLGTSKQELKVKPNDSLKNLRADICKLYQLPTDSVRLFFGGKEMTSDQDNMSLSHFKLAEGLTIQAQKKNIGGRAPPLIPESALNKNVATETGLREIYPSQILSKQEYFTQLFDLLDVDLFADAVWELLMSLPTNTTIYNDIKNFHQDTQPQVQLEKLFKSGLNVFKLYYRLQIVQSFLNISVEDDPEDVQQDKIVWQQCFLIHGGVKLLLNLVLTSDFYVDQQQLSKNRANCLALLLKLVASYVTDKTQFVKSVFDQNIDAKSLLPRLLQLTWQFSLPAVQVFSPNCGPSIFPPDVAVVSSAFALINACCLSDQGLYEILVNFVNYKPWVRALLVQCTELSIRKEVATLIESFCAVYPEVAPQYHLRLLLSVFEEVGSSRAKSWNEYFEELTRLLERSAKAAQVNLANLLSDLVTVLKSRPVYELRFSDEEDAVLIGVLNLLAALVKNDSSLKHVAGVEGSHNLVIYVFNDCLFDIPESGNHDLSAPPKCKSKRSRRAAFRLLTELSKDCVPNFASLIARLLKQNRLSERKASWNYTPTIYEKSKTGFVGLRNLGATCYMNSLLQQFYMIPHFRYNLLKAPIGEILAKQAVPSGLDVSQMDEKQIENSKLKENLLYQLQVLFSYLQESEKRFYDTREFCRSYKYEGQPVNTSVQMDADEFFNMIFDRLESLLKGTAQESVLKQFFGGEIINQVISKDCPHLSERVEGFFALSIEVKGKKNILESLELFVKGDVLEGDNKYFCDSCKAKVNAVRRSCVNSLPDNLIVHQKRFEFDLELLRRVKLNDYCEFPMTLDMKPYTKEGLLAKESKEGDAKSTPTEPRDDSYYQYRLAGVLVHSGTADSGHYYSYIKERDENGGDGTWYHFNDSDVETFDLSNLPAACYGGFEDVMVWDNSQSRQMNRSQLKSYSAYMLFYERVKPINTNRTRLATVLEAQVVQPAVFSNIWQENMNFMRDKNLFDSAYFSFVWGIVTLHPESNPLKSLALNPNKHSQAANSDNYDVLFASIRLGTRHLISVLSHAKDRSNLKEIGQTLQKMYSAHPTAAQWFIGRLTRDLALIKNIFFNCSISETREVFASLVAHVLELVAKKEEDIFLVDLPSTNSKMDVDQPIPTQQPIQESGEKRSTSPAKRRAEEEDLQYPVPKRTAVSSAISIRFMDTCLDLLKEASMHWSTFREFFMLFKSFAAIGPKEVEYFVQRQAITQMVDFFLGDDSPYKPPQRRKRGKMGEKGVQPKLEYMVEFLSIIARSCRTQAGIPPSCITTIPFTLGDQDRSMLLNLTLLDLLLNDINNSKSIGEIVSHFCWEDEPLSLRVADCIIDAMDKFYEANIKGFIDVLGALWLLDDSKKASRFEHCLKRFYSFCERNTKFSHLGRQVVCFVAEYAKNEIVVEILYQTRNQWIEMWFLQSDWDASRDAALVLIQACVGNRFPIMPEDSKIFDQGISQDVIKQITPQTQQRLHEMLRSLFSLFEKTNDYYTPMENKAENSSWKLVKYYRLMKWWCFSRVEKELFMEFFESFTRSFVAWGEQHHNADENRAEITRFMLHIACEIPQFNKLMPESKAVGTIVDFYVSLSPNLVGYNSVALVPWYTLELLWARASPSFLQKLSAHSNFEWALSNLVFGETAYPEVAVPVFAIAELCCEIDSFRSHWSANVLRGHRVDHNPIFAVKLLNTSLRSGNDFASFFKAKGLDHLSKQLEKLISNLEHVSHVLIEQFCVLIQKIVKQSTHDAINSWDSSIRAQLHDTILRKIPELSTSTVTVFAEVLEVDLLLNDIDKDIILLVIFDDLSTNINFQNLPNFSFPVFFKYVKRLCLLRIEALKQQAQQHKALMRETTQVMEISPKQDQEKTNEQTIVDKDMTESEGSSSNLNNNNNNNNNEKSTPPVTIEINNNNKNKEEENDQIQISSSELSPVLMIASKVIENGAQSGDAIESVGFFCDLWTNQFTRATLMEFAQNLLQFILLKRISVISFLHPSSVETILDMIKTVQMEDEAKNRIKKDLLSYLLQQIQQFLTSTELGAGAQIFMKFSSEVTFILKLLKLICTTQEFDSIRNDLKNPLAALRQRITHLEQTMNKTISSPTNGNNSIEEEIKQQQATIQQLTDFLKSMSLF